MRKVVKTRRRILSISQLNLKSSIQSLLLWKNFMDAWITASLPNGRLAYSPLFWKKCVMLTHLSIGGWFWMDLLTLFGLRRWTQYLTTVSCLPLPMVIALKSKKTFVYFSKLRILTWLLLLPFLELVWFTLTLMNLDGNRLLRVGCLLKSKWEKITQLCLMNASTNTLRKSWWLRKQTAKKS